jgi:hypothetical protein
MSDFGQPYGDPAQQPAGGSPPPYPAAQPGPPRYPAQPSQYPSPYGAAPTFPYQDPPPKKSRTWLIIGIVLAVILVLCLGAVVVGALVYNAGNQNPNPRGSSDAATPSPQAGPVRLTDPNQIGDLVKSADQSSAATLRATLTTGGIEEPFAAVYEDTATSGRQVVVWGGTGPIFGAGSTQAQLDGFFSSAGKQLSGGTISERGPVSPGTVGGVAECEKVSGMGVAMALCAWIGDDALVGFIFTGYAPAEAGSAMPEILSAIVKQ